MYMTDRARNYYTRDLEKVQGISTDLFQKVGEVGPAAREKRLETVRAAVKPSQHGEISAVIPDWSREAPTRWWDPGRQLLRCIRNYQHWGSRRGWLYIVPRKYQVLKHRFWSVVSGADIPLNAHVDGGLQLLHPNGIVIHPEARIGPNCIFFQQVTIGTRENSPRVPWIGGDVSIGAGAKVLGGIRVGDHARIGANAVVLCDVPDGAVAVGIPARILQPRES